MTQAIITKFIPATNTRGARIKASAWAGSVVIPYDYSGDEAHWKAACAFIDRFGWDAIGWTRGGSPDASGFVFVRSDAVAALEKIEQQLDYGQTDAALKIARDAIAASQRD